MICRLLKQSRQAADQISMLEKQNHSPVNKNIMNLFFIHPTKKQDEADKHTLVLLHNQEHDTNEGSEFMDDAIRTEDLPPPLDTEENITEGES